MMNWGWGYGYNQMMSGGLFGGFGFLLMSVWLVAGVLLIIYLWQNISKK